MDTFKNYLKETQMYVVIADVKGGKKQDVITKPLSKQKADDFVKIFLRQLSGKNSTFTNVKIVKAK